MTSTILLLSVVTNTLRGQLVATATARDIKQFRNVPLDPGKDLGAGDSVKYWAGESRRAK